jgi:hypothetical protein
MDELSPGLRDGNAMDNPLAGTSVDQPAATVVRETELPDEMVLMPDFFKPFRRLLARPDGSPRLLVPVSLCIAAYGFVCFPLTCIWVRELTPAEGPAGGPNLRDTAQLLPLVFFGPGLTLPMTYVWLLHDVVRAGGPLEQLGAGEKKTATRHVRRLRCWRTLLTIAVTPVMLVGPLLFGLFWVQIMRSILGIGDLGESAEALVVWHPLALSFWVPSLSVMIGFPCGAAWFFSLKVAVVLAQDDVEGVVARTTFETMADDSLWDSVVARPAIRLALHTMRLLSSWGTGTWVFCLIMICISLQNFSAFANCIIIPDADLACGDTGMARKFAAVIGAALAPLFISADVAHVSSLCDVRARGPSHTFKSPCRVPRYSRSI